jgi:hypothetical protein
MLKRLLMRKMLVASIAVVLCQLSIGWLSRGDPQEALAADELISRAVLPAATFAPGPTSARGGRR